MALSMPVCMMGQLKDQRVEVTERLKLAGKLWLTQDEVGPNKHQVIMDTVITILINNKKRHELSREAEREAWQTLSSLLNSPEIRQPSNINSAVTIRPTTAQMLVETLESEVKQQSGEVREGTVSLVLDCCRFILQAPTLACTITSRLDILVRLCSVVCQLAVSLLPAVGTPSLDLCPLLSQLTTHLWQHHHRSQVVPSQMLQVVTERLLQPVLTLSYQTHCVERFSQLSNSANSLLDLLLATLFHQSHQKLFKTYLDGIAKKQEVSHVPWSVSSVFNKLSAGLQQRQTEGGASLENALDRRVVLHFLPLLFQHAVTAWKQSEQLGFQLFVHLNSYLGMPGDKVGTEQPDGAVAMETECIDTLSQLLSVVKADGVYNVAADRTGDGSQLRYFRHLLNRLVHSPMCEELCRCLLVLLQLNHLILEPSLPAILHHCCSDLAQMSEQCRAGLGALLSELVSTYSLLHQVPHCYSLLLQLNAQSPQQLIDMLALPDCSHRLHAVLRTLTPTTAVKVWSGLQAEVAAITQKTLHQHTATDQYRLWGACLLLNQCLNHAPVYELSMTVRVLDKVGVLLSDLEHKLVSPLLQHVQLNSEDKLLRRSVLLLAVCLGQEKLTLSPYQSGPISLPTTSIDHLPFSLRLSDLVNKKKVSGLDAVERFLWDVLTTHRLLLLQQKGETADWSHLLAILVVGGNVSPKLIQCHWDGNICSVSEDTYLVAKFQLLVFHCSHLLPSIVGQHAARLAQFVVQVFAQSPPTGTAHSNSYSCLGVACQLFKQTVLTDSQDFYHNVVCAMWHNFARCAADEGWPGKVVTIVQQLGQSNVPWGDVSHRQVKWVARAVQELLTSSCVQHQHLSETQTALLQMLQHIRLNALPAGSRLQCILGLLAVLWHQDKRCFSPTGDRPQQPGCQGVGDMLSHLLAVLLDASVGTSVFCCLPPRVLLQCLRTMVTQCEVSERSCLGVLLRKAVVVVMGDFHSVLHLEDCITHLEAGLKKMCEEIASRTVDLSQAVHKVLLNVTSYVLCETHRHLKKDFFRQDVQSSSRQHFTRLSVAVEDVVDACERRQSQSSLHPSLLQCFSAIMLQRCVDAAEGNNSLQPEQLLRAQFVLSTLCLTSTNSQRQEPLAEELAFVSCLYRQQAALCSLLVPHFTQMLWTSLLSHLHGHCHDRAVTNRKEEQSSMEGAGQHPLAACSKRRQQEHGPWSGTPNKMPRLDGQQPAMPEDVCGDKMQPACAGSVDGKAFGCVTLDGHRMGGSATWQPQEAGSVQEKTEGILDTLTVVLTSCPISLFTQLLQQLISPTVSCVHQSVSVWQRVVGCDTLTVEQRQLLESFSITALQQCVEMMQQVHSCPHVLAVNTCLAVLGCLATMLSKQKLLSSKGTVLCLLCVSLVPLQQVDYDRFLLLLPAMCHVLHAVLIHHPHTTIRVLEDCLALVSSVLKECIHRGDQKLLLGNPDYIKPMTKCAGLVSRLVMLMLSHRTELQRVVATLVSDYANAVKSITLLPVVKKSMLSGVYACLDICDKHSISQLRMRLPPGVREVFHMLHNDYTNYYKYTGKV